MPSNAIRIRAAERDGIVNIQCLMPHPMETGRRLDERGQAVPAHWIREITVECGGRPVAKLWVNPGVSRDPYMGFRCKGAKGETVRVAWLDSKGEQASAEEVVK